MTRAPPASSAATYPTFPSKPSGMPHAIVGTPARSSALTIGLPWWDEMSSTPSTWPAVTYAVMRARSSGVPATMSSSGISRLASASAAPRSRIEKFGSSNSRCWGSVSRNATEFERPVTRLRACWFAAYPVARIASLTAASASGDTQCPPLMTRETVPRETPAAAATSRMVGRLRAACWWSTERDSRRTSGLHRARREVDLPVPLQREEQRDERDDGQQRARDHRRVHRGLRRPLVEQAREPHGDREQLVVAEHDVRQHEVVPDRDELEQEDRDEPRQHHRHRDGPEDRK